MPLAAYLVYWSDSQLQTFSGSHPLDRELTLRGYNAEEIKKKIKKKTINKDKKNPATKEETPYKITGAISTPFKIFLDIVDNEPTLLVSLVSKKSYFNRTLTVNLIRSGVVFKTFKRKLKLLKGIPEQYSIKLTQKELDEQFFVEAHFLEKHNMYNNFRDSVRCIDFFKIDKSIVIDGNLNEWQGNIALQHQDFLLNHDLSKVFTEKRMHRDYLSNFIIFNPQKISGRSFENALFREENEIIKPRDDFEIHHALAYDKEYCYLAFKIIDSEFIHNPDFIPNQILRGIKPDHLEFAFDLFIKKDTEVTKYNDDDTLVYLIPGSDSKLNVIAFRGKLPVKGLFKKSKFFTTITDDGYIVECAILWNELNPSFDPSQTKAIGFNYSVYDADKNDSLSWSYNTNIRFGINSTLFPKLFATGLLK
jgi:hypothetical protein